jgi:hypothetical protein
VVFSRQFHITIAAGERQAKPQTDAWNTADAALYPPPNGKFLACVLPRSCIEICPSPKKPLHRLASLTYVNGTTWRFD